MYACINKIKGLTLLLFVLLLPVGVFAQTATSDLKVEGSVVDANTGLSVVGARVSVSGFSSVLTKDDGSFSLKIPRNNATVQIDAAGYQYKELALKGKDKVTIKLVEESFNSFYDAAFTPYGYKSMNTTAGAVSVASGTNAWKSTEVSPDDFINGKLSGLNVKARSGMPGIGDNMFLRGYSSLLSSNQPSIVVDGVLYENDYLGTPLFSYDRVNPLSYIDIRDIENITIIKDATASFYGAKSSNGVIVINTKRAKEVTTHIDFMAYGGANFTPTEVPVMNANDYRNYLTNILQTKSGFSTSQLETLPYMNDNTSSSDYYTYHNNTNWQKEVFKNSNDQNIYLKVTGGDAYAKYALSVGSLKHSNVVDGTDFQRYIVRFNSDITFSPRLGVNANFSLANTIGNVMDDGVSNINPINLSLRKAPFLASHAMTSEGVVSPNFSGNDIFNVSNPSALISNYIGETRNYRFNGTIKADYKLNNNLSLSSLISLDFDKVRERLFVPYAGVTPDSTIYGAMVSKTAARADKLYSIYSDTRLSFKKVYNNIHSLDASVGFRFNPVKSENIEVSQYANKNNDNFHNVGYGSSSIGYRVVDGGIGNWTQMGFYSTVNYGLLSKYFLEFNVALDGSSKFGKRADQGVTLFDNSFGVFPSLGAAWLVSSENFMKDLNLVDMLKLRASYGLTGNDDIGLYSSKQYYSSTYYSGVYGLVLGNIANDQLQWETVKKFNVGADLGLFNERFSVSFDYYNNRTDHMLTYVPAPAASGYDYLTMNSAKMENKGFEVTVNSRIVNNKFKWDLGFSIAKYKNKLVSNPEDEVVTNLNDAQILSKVGNPVGLFYGYKTNGVYATDQAAAADGYTTNVSGTQTAFTGGDVRFMDNNGDKIIDKLDRQVIGDPNPDFTGAITTKLAYKRFALDALLTFSYGNDVFNYQRYMLESMKGYDNQTQAVINRWRKNGDVTSMPKATWGDPMGNSRFSDRWIENGSYIRLKTITLSYNIPVKPKFLQNASVFVSGYNVFTITKYLGWDPEFSSNGHSWGQGVDLGLSPQFTSVFVGVRLGL